MKIVSIIMIIIAVPFILGIFMIPYEIIFCHEEFVKEVLAKSNSVIAAYFLTGVMWLLGWFLLFSTPKIVTQLWRGY